MKTKLALTLLVMAAVSINLYAATSALPAPLPDFMDQAQLAKWSADQAVAAKTTVSASEPSTQFYTGKPYVADAGGYIYKYRTYNPEMSRWTSADPSGFPDGANGQIYAPVPTTASDPTGLFEINAIGASPTSASLTVGSGTYTVTAMIMTISGVTSASGSATVGLYKAWVSGINMGISIAVSGDNNTTYSQSVSTNTPLINPTTGELYAYEGSPDSNGMYNFLDGGTQNYQGATNGVATDAPYDPYTDAPATLSLTLTVYNDSGAVGGVINYGFTIE